jgi:hypothetical protein
VTAECRSEVPAGADVDHLGAESPRT